MLRIIKKHMAIKISVFVLTTFFCWFVQVNDSYALTFYEALDQAYQNNPELISARYELKATKEEKDIARSGWRPTIAGDASFGYDRSTINNNSADSNTPSGVGLTVSQPLFSGGSTFAEVKSAQYRIQAQEALLRIEEQQILLQAAQAYLNVLRFEEVLEINEHNVRVLSQQFEAEQQKFDLGDSTLTDVSQAQARLEGAKASRMEARANLDKAMAAFERYIGLPPVDIAMPELDIELPLSVKHALEIALKDSPVVIYARNAQKMADKNVDAIFGEMLPQLQVVGETRYNEDVSSTIDESESSSVMLRLDIPIYQSGAVRGRKKQAQALASQRMLDITAAEKQVRENVLSSWQTLAASKISVNARFSQVQSADLALEGVREEEKLGSRTTLDVLDAEQESLDAKVALIEVKHSVKLQTLRVLAAMGHLVPKVIGMKIAKKPTENESRL